jgi:hypothetical protein
MSWLFSRALVAEYSADISLDGAQSALWSGTHTQRASWLPVKTTDAFRLSRSGMTFRPLTDDHGEVVLMSFLAAFPVRTFPQQEKAPELTENAAECGDTWRASLAKYDPDSSSWKTHQYSLLGDLEPFSETWPRWGIMRNGECWELSTPGLPTSESESGLWPTPTRDSATERFGCYAQGGLPLTAAVKMWPTPTAQDAKNNGAPSQHDRNTAPLNAQVGGALNPTWVEWLMGWPLGWTDCDASATDKFHFAQPWHGKSFQEWLDINAKALETCVQYDTRRKETQKSG